MIKLEPISYPPDIIHMVNETRPSSFSPAFPLSCIAKLIRRNRGGLGTRLLCVAQTNCFFLLLLLASPQCVHGFLNEEAVRIAADVYATEEEGGNFMYMYDWQLIIPNMTFTSNGSVVRWTFAARYRASATQYPELQVWRETTTGTYVKVGSTGNMEPAQTAYLNVYEYVLDPPLQVLAGDVLGIYQPSSNSSRLHLLFLQNFSYVNWYTDVSEPQESFMVAGSQTNNVLPLVTVSFEPEGELSQHSKLRDADGIVHSLLYQPLF